MQKKQPILHLLSTHIFRVLIYTDAGQKSRGFIKSSEMFAVLFAFRLQTHYNSPDKVGKDDFDAV